MLVGCGVVDRLHIECLVQSFQSALIANRAQQRYYWKTVIFFMAKRLKLLLNVVERKL